MFSKKTFLIELRLIDFFFFIDFQEVRKTFVNRAYKKTKEMFFFFCRIKYLLYICIAIENNGSQTEQKIMRE